MPRLGEILLSEKLLTSRELESALENHILHGVKLGTCLVEMGYVRDDDLSRCLGKQTGYDFLTKDQLFAVASQNLALITPAVMKKHRLIPAGIDGSTLRIATDNEFTPKKLIELEQFIGRKLSPVAVSGYAIDCFFEKMFGIKRPGRFIQNYSSKKKNGSEGHSASSANSSKREETSLIINGVEWQSLDAVTKDAEYDQSFDTENRLRQEAAFSPLTLSEVSQCLNNAKSRDDVAKASLDFLARSRQVVALLIIKDMVALGWSAISSRKKLHHFKDLTFSIPQIPDLFQCVTTQRPYSGRSYSQETELLLRELHHEDKQLAYFPVSIQQHVVSVLICDSSEEFNFAEVTELSRKISYSLAILILRSKLLS